MIEAKPLRLNIRLFLLTFSYLLVEFTDLSGTEELLYILIELKNGFGFLNNIVHIWHE